MLSRLAPASTLSTSGCSTLRAIERKAEAMDWERLSRSRAWLFWSMVIPALLTGAGSVYLAHIIGSQHTTTAAGLGRTSQLPRLDGETRNARSVWTITPKPYKGAHFAVFPPELPEKCIKAGSSERGGCRKCGAPWVRQIEKRRTPDRPGRVQGRLGDTIADAHGPDGRTGKRHRLHVLTTGWAPSCACDTSAEPCLVLDPFAGSGTTLAVARGLGRDYVGVELNREYITLARRRLSSGEPEAAE